MAVKQWRMWEWPALTTLDRTSNSDMIYYAVAGPFTLFFSGLSIPFMIAGPFWFPWYIGVMTAILIAAFICLGIPSAGRLGELWGIPEAGDYSYRDTANLRGTARKIQRLPAKDRGEFPSDIFKVMKNPDLNSQQKNGLNQACLETLNVIGARNEEKRQLIARGNQTDIQYVLDRLADSRTGLEAEREVLRELE